MVQLLFTVSRKPDGSFPPELRRSPASRCGPVLQLDEVALPIVLAHLVGSDGAGTYAHVKKAADFLVDFVDPETGRHAPFTPQERWENQSGYSPNTIAAEIAGLVCAADLARRHGDHASARRWLRVADRWEAHVKKWTADHQRSTEHEPVLLRLTKNGSRTPG